MVLSLGLAGHLAANLAMTSGLLYVSGLNYSGSLHLLDAASPSPGPVSDQAG